MEVLIGYAIGLVAIYIICKLLALPIKLMCKLIFNGLVGGLTLIVVNIIGGIFGITVSINILSALIAGFFGLPGVILLIFLNNF